MEDKKPEHVEKASVVFNNGANRFCFDEVIRHDENDRIEYSIVWRGTSVSPDGFVMKPAYFSMELLGKLIARLHKISCISATQKQELLTDFLNGFVSVSTEQ